jgi:Acetyltransferase (GNAT) family
VACLERELVGQLDIHTFPNRPRRRHAGQLGMAVRDEFQRRGVGTALLQAAVDLADKWLNLLRLELEVYSDHEPALRLYKRFGFAVAHCFAMPIGLDQAMPTNTRPSAARMPLLPHGRRMNPSQAVGLFKQMPFRHEGFGARITHLLTRT